MIIYDSIDPALFSISDNGNVISDGKTLFRLYYKNHRLVFAHKKSNIDPPYGITQGYGNKVIQFSPDEYLKPMFESIVIGVEKSLISYFKKAYKNDDADFKIVTDISNINLKLKESSSLFNVNEDTKDHKLVHNINKYIGKPINLYASISVPSILLDVSTGDVNVYIQFVLDQAEVEEVFILTR
jgi:hypothetical protein